MLPFEGWHARQLIQAARPFSWLGPCSGLRIDLTPLADLLVPLGIGHLGQPGAEPVRLEPPFFAPARGRSWGDVLDHPSRLQLVRDFAPRPLADGPSRFGG